MKKTDITEKNVMPNKSNNKTKKNNISLNSPIIEPTPKAKSNNIKSKIVVKFMELLNLVKIYHWKTKSYSQHKATDELHQRLSENIDRFVEVLLGKDESRVRLVGNKIMIIDSNGETDFKKRLFGFRRFLVELDGHLDKRGDTDLLNIRDEMLANVNQFLYLMSFDS
jgi:hypothetical protein